jgi:hypothetical protein
VARLQESAAEHERERERAARERERAAGEMSLVTETNLRLEEQVQLRGAVVNHLHQDLVASETMVFVIFALFMRADKVLCVCVCIYVHMEN